MRRYLYMENDMEKLTGGGTLCKSILWPLPV